MRNELLQLGGGANRLAIQILGNRDDAADAVQDALTQVLARPRAYNPDKGALKPWFLRVVRNRCLDVIRRRRPTDNAVAELPDRGLLPDAALECAQRDEGLQRALMALTFEQREIVTLRDMLSLSYADIAQVLGVAPGTVMSRLHRARLALREELKDHV